MIIKTAYFNDKGLFVNEVFYPLNADYEITRKLMQQIRLSTKKVP